MNVWIEDKIGYLTGYSLMEQPNAVKVEADEEPLDFTTWRYDGTKLIHDPDNAPQPDPVPPSDIDLLKQQNEKLALQVVKAQKEQRKNNKLIADLMLKIEELEKKVVGD